MEGRTRVDRVSRARGIVRCAISHVIEPARASRPVRQPAAARLLCSTACHSQSDAVLATVTFCAWLVPLDALAQERADADKTLSPYFFVEGGDPAIDRLPLKSTRVDVAITGVIADVTVRQVYENRGQRPLHARYIFPASTRAAVYGMTMTVGDVRIVAKIKQREQAKTRVRDRQEGREERLAARAEPSQRVLDECRQRAARATRFSVELKYTELLVPTDGQYEFVYPTVVGPRYSEKRESDALASPKPSGEGGSPGDEFVKAPYTRQGEAPRSEFHLAGVVSSGRAVSGARVTVASARHPHDRSRTRGHVARRFREALGQSRLHPSLSTGRPDDRRGTPPVPGARRELLPAHGGAAAGRGARRDPAARVRVRDRRVGIDVRLSVGYREDADGRSRERASTLGHLQHPRLCQRF